MQINQVKTVPVQAKTMRMSLKVCDEFSADILDENGNQLGGQEDGYVPDHSLPGYLLRHNRNFYGHLHCKDMFSGRCRRARRG